MSISPDQITIAITVYNRRQYIKQAISSALKQTCPVQVMVVEDCGPDLELQDFVLKEFADTVRYVRNPARRGLFGNWNACLELCRTKWISILHDDDYLAPRFVEAIVDLAKKAPDCLLYFGAVSIVDAQGKSETNDEHQVLVGDWMHRDLKDITYGPFPFPGHVFEVKAARELGGFRETSLFAGDWEMWAKLMAAGKAAQTAQIVAFYRAHEGVERGTNQIVGSGRSYPATLIQHKRVLALRSDHPRFDRRSWLKAFPFSASYLLSNGCALKPRLLRYFLGHLRLSRAPSFRYRMFQTGARLGGQPFVYAASKVWNWTRGRSKPGQQ